MIVVLAQVLGLADVEAVTANISDLERVAGLHEGAVLHFGRLPSQGVAIRLLILIQFRAVRQIDLFDREGLGDLSEAAIVVPVRVADHDRIDLFNARLLQLLNDGPRGLPLCAVDQDTVRDRDIIIGILQDGCAVAKKRFVALEKPDRPDPDAGMVPLRSVLSTGLEHDRLRESCSLDQGEALLGIRLTGKSADLDLVPPSGADDGHGDLFNESLLFQVLFDAGFYDQGCRDRSGTVLVGPCLDFIKYCHFLTPPQLPM